MNMFNDIKTEGMEEAKDVVGGNFEPVPTDIYDAIVKVAYAGQSAGGAKNVTIILDVGGKEVKETIYVTSKKGEAFYLDDKNRKQPLPGWTNVEDFCLFTTEKTLPEATFEEKVVKVYDPAEGKEVNKPVPVLTEALGKTVRVAIQRQIVDKQKKGDDGEYHDTGETRTQNEFIKFVHPETSRTINEYKTNVEESVWADTWLARFKGKDRNKAKNAGNDTSGSTGSGRPGAAGGAQKKTGSLFGNK